MSSGGSVVRPLAFAGGAWRRQEREQAKGEASRSQSSSIPRNKA